MIRAMLNEGRCHVKTEGNVLSLMADLLASPAVIINAVCERLGLPEEIKKDIVREIIKDLEEKFLQ